ncbi:MAG: efflux RND transporter periplasmic adaptor subunit [Bacteroidota bacterium]
MNRASVFCYTLLFAGLALTQTACEDARSESPEEEEQGIVVPVEVAETTAGPIAAYFASTATLEAEQEALVVAKAGGVVQQILAEEGQYVQAGQALAKLDSRQAQLEVTQLEATISRLENEFQRQQDLFDKKLISAQEFETSKFDFESQKAALELRRLQVDYATVRAPISGIVSERLVKKGNMVAQNAGTFRITDFNPLHAVVNVPERELAKLKAGQEAALYVDALPGQTFSGKILRISPIVDPTTGTFRATVAVQNRKRELKPGMLARVNITYDVREDVILAPRESIVREDDRSLVYVVRNDSAFRVDVSTGYEDDGSIEIQSGLQAGDVVVTLGQGSLADSTAVQVVQ